MPIKPYLYTSEEKNPYAKDPNYVEVKERKEKLYRGNNYQKIIYKNSSPHGFCWKVSKTFLLFLRCLTIIPLIVNKTNIKKSWKRIKAGEEKIVVLVEKNESIVSEVVANKKNKVEKKVQIGPVHTRFFNASEPPINVANNGSVVLEDQVKSELSNTEKLDQIVKNYPNLNEDQAWFLNALLNWANEPQKTSVEIKEIFEDISSILNFEFAKAYYEEVNGKGSTTSIDAQTSIINDLKARMEDIKKCISPETYPEQTRRFVHNSTRGAIMVNEDEGPFGEQEIFFEENEILKKEEIQKGEILAKFEKNFIPIFYTMYNKSILLQQFSYGSFEASLAMLLLDERVKIDVQLFKEPTTLDDFNLKINNWGLTAFYTNIKIGSAEQYLKLLQDAINQQGSLIVNLNQEDRSIVIDEISVDLKSVRLRDPSHGWEITISSEALMKRKPNPMFVQLKKN